ncbi:uncharacterized protein LOC120339929 [Styela clava]
MLYIVYFGFLMTAVIVQSSPCTRIEEDEKCVIPVLDEIDWNRLPGTWYLTMNIKDQVEQTASCFELRDIRDTDSGVYIEFRDIHVFPNKSKIHGTVPFHWIHMHDSIVKSDEKYELLFIEEIKKYGGDREAIADIKEVYKQPMSCMTDYKNQLICFECYEDGTRHVWVHTKNPRLNAEDVLNIRNELIELGGGWSEVKLYLSGCSNL